MPIVEDLIDRLSGCKYFTSLDLKCGYYQIKIKEDSISKSAFITSEGHYEYVRMPLGICNGPAVFQRLMDKVLGKLRFGRIICFMDDLLIATKSIEENMQCLESVLKVLQENGLTINLEKCNFFQNKINFLGYEISNEGIRPGTKKLSAIKDYPTPVNVHQVRQFLGLVNYFRKFVKNCAILCRPLTKLLKKGIAWEWGEEQNKTVNALKNELLTNSLLTIFDPKLPIILYTDASRDGLGCIVVQVTKEGEKPIYFYSRQTTMEEKKYHSFELELLAIVVGLKRFRHYLLGNRFKIVTDCNAVRYSITKQEINSRIGRWVLQTQEFDFDIVHRPGAQMQHVDALSRSPVGYSAVGANESVMSISIMEPDWLLSVQLQDPCICSIREILVSGEAESHKQIFNNYELLGNKVYRRTEYGRRWLVPKQCIWQVIRANHDDIGHFAVDKTIERIKSKYWFTHMKRIVTKYVNNCMNCIYNKNIHGKKEGKLYPIPKYARPFHTLHIDHLGPFVKSTKKNTHLLVMVDSFTKFVFIAPVQNTKSKCVINELNNLFKVFGNPNRIICDAGSAFTSKMFRDFCIDRKIRQHVIATAMPRSNGQVERYNLTVLEAMRSKGADTDNNKWDTYITDIQQGINSTINKSTAAVPSEVFFGYRLQVDSDIPMDESNEQVVDVTALRKTVDKNIKMTAEKQKQLFDSKRKNAKDYKVGDLVVIKIPSQSNDGQSTKLLPLFKGPFQVIEVLGHDRYKVADMRGAQRTARRYEGVTCVENMKPWIRIADSQVDYGTPAV
jgi:transposase InsO family protein